MTASILPQDRTARRVSKAAGIVTRQECIPVDDLDGWFQVRDTQTGSGAWHLATAQRCDCRDALRGTCKHQIAVRAEEQALRQFAADWDSRAEQQRQTINSDRDHFPCCPTCGAGLECQSYHIGGRGMMAFLVCTKDAQHQALPA